MTSKRITIIGGGPGGYTAAFAAARAGGEVTLIEAGHFGGVCLNTGCIPTKTLKASADLLEAARRLTEFGLQGTAAQIDMPAVQARKERVMATLRAGLEKTCATLKIRTIRGWGRLSDAGLVTVTDADGRETAVTGDRVILATGSTPLALPNLPFDHTAILSSDDILGLRELPRRLLIVGGGVIGCEIASIFQAFGSQVCVVEGQDRLLPLPSIDGEISAVLQREMKKRRIPFHLGRIVTAVQREGGALSVELSPSPFSANPPQDRITAEADAVLASVGRAPNTTDLGLAEAGVRQDDRGWIIADEYLQTSLPGVYAIGDILGPQKGMLAHVASMEGLCAAANCLGGKRAMEYEPIPSAVFTTPEIGCAGYGEQQARSMGLNVACHTFQMRQLGKMQAMGEVGGICKLVADADSGVLLGAHMAGPHATDIAAELTLAVKMRATVADLASTMHAHPTLAEGVWEAALALQENQKN